MENQNIPPFPFDAFDLPFDGADDSMVPDIFPPALSRPAGEEGSPALQSIRRTLQDLDDQLRTLLQLIDRELQQPTEVMTLEGGRDAKWSASESRRAMPKPRPVDPLTSSLQREDDPSVRVIEGVFDGQNMVGPDGKQYSIPANYSSKSKLVEGDILKLRITSRGAFVYKQIGPIARERRIGVLERDDVTSEFVVIVPDADAERSGVTQAILTRGDLPDVPYKRYRVLRASVTYYRGNAGDEAVVLVPKGAPSTWAAVENIVKR